MLKPLIIFLLLILSTSGMCQSQDRNEKLGKYRTFLNQQSKSIHSKNDSLDIFISELKNQSSLLALGFAEELKAIQEDNIDKKIQSYKDAIEYYNKCGEVLRLTEVYPTLVFLLQFYSRNGEAMEYAIKSVEFSKTNIDVPLLITSLVDLGKLLHQNKQYLESKNRLIEAYNIHQNHQDVISNVYSQLGEVFILLNKTDSAIYYIDKGLEWTKKLNQNEEALNLRVMKGKAYLYNNQLTKAEEIFTKELKEVEYSPIQKSKLPSMYYLQAQLFNKLHKHQNAIEALNKALEVLGNRKNWRLISNIRNEKVLALKSIGEFKQAIEETNLWKLAIDSLQEVEKKALFADAASRYKTTKLQEQISEQELQLQTAKYKNRWFLALLFLSLAVALGIYQYMKNKNQKTHFEAQLIKLESNRIKELDKVKSAFFTNISHEFRTPLTLIIEPLKTLDRELREGSYKNLFKRMRYAADSMLKLINEMLDLAKIESGSRKLKTEDGELTSFVNKLCFAVQSLADLKHIDLSIQIPESPLYLKYDKACLETIIINLLNNAIKYTPEFGSVNLELSQIEDKTIVAISDTGIGIDNQHLPHIFDRFYRVEKETDEAVGSGIGLALINELVELHGGTIYLESKINVGSKFVIELPLEKCNPIEYEKIKREESRPYSIGKYSTQKQIEAQKILIVEDNEELAIHIKELLKDIEEVHTAANGRVGFEIAVDEIPDIIITDLIMPELDGMELISKLRNDERTNHIPIILLTGNTEIENRIESWKRGTDAYLNKPVVTEELLSVIENLLHQRILLQQRYSTIIYEHKAEQNKHLTQEEVFINKVLEVIESNYEDELFSVELLAEQVHMSRSNLFRKISAITGNNPTILIRDYRLNKAMQLLMKGHLPKEVCFLTGFNSFSYFSKCFKDKFDLVPSEIKKS